MTLKEFLKSGADYRRDVNIITAAAVVALAIWASGLAPWPEQNGLERFAALITPLAVVLLAAVRAYSKAAKAWKYRNKKEAMQ